ncbi:SUR7/PalI family-domain-containing protein [Clohesyomyces aquaticus]|uniref:SUR7/PalI family-domain-containing protein n=1 Tax=Clohesyomyces aquaticus TaxID=1231657 RepID=A0A1Y2ABS0_9PLEO|nr:SUR7/PalI family-domain-containing protein [Clohesyomyces aquaticus]
MGKLGRFACIFTPMALTLASLVCLVLVFSGQLNKNMALQRDLWFFKANTKEFTVNPDIAPNSNLDNVLLSSLEASASSGELKDFYQVGLWNYCEGEINDGHEKITYCSPRKVYFWFNPIEVWELKNTTAQQVFPDKMKNGIDAYHKVSKWMFAAYVIAICLTAAELVVGIFAIFSRWGSLVTTIVSTASTLFVLAAAITSTALYGALAGTFDSVLKPMKIKASVGTKMLSVVWLAVAFSVASGFFWLISVCCCSGKSGHKKVVVEKTPYTYERVASPYLGHRQQGNELHNLPQSGTTTSGHAYEPFRHERV